MDSDENYEVPFEIDAAEATDGAYEDVTDDNEAEASESSKIHEIDPADAEEIAAARETFENDRLEPGDDVDLMDDEDAVAVATPFVQSWRSLVSTTNWEKGRIISQWRAALIENEAAAVAYSDAAWVRRVGGVTAPHVGRLRRVYDQFADTFESYEGLYWTHFLAAMDWDDAPLWLEGAVHEGWSVSQMRDARWRAMGAVESKRPTASEVIEVDLDEDVAIAGEDDRDGKGKRDFDGSGPGPTGPQYDEADFGDADELVSLAGSESPNSPSAIAGEGPAAVTQPFRDLPDLPDDLSDAIETLKLAVLRHKTGGWQDVDAETLERYFKAMTQLLH